MQMIKQKKVDTKVHSQIIRNYLNINKLTIFIICKKMIDTFPRFSKKKKK